MDARTLQIIKDKEIIGKMISLNRYYKNAYLERRNGAYERMQNEARKALRFLLR